MNSARLEAFSDGVIAIIITIMVLELKIPEGRTLDALLQQLIIRAQGPESLLKKAVRGDWKGKVSPILYLVGIIAAYWAPRLAQALYLLVALLWFIPDRRIEDVIATKP
jgi:uncharacterized membrane protein